VHIPLELGVEPYLALVDFPLPAVALRPAMGASRAVRMAIASAAVHFIADGADIASQLPGNVSKRASLDEHSADFFPLIRGQTVILHMSNALLLIRLCYQKCCVRF